MQEHLSLLCLEVVDRPSGYKGIVTSISFDMSGCVQAYVRAGIDKDGKLADGYWFDTKRLRVIGEKPVIDPPTFRAIPGGQALPAPDRR